MIQLLEVVHLNKGNRDGVLTAENETEIATVPLALAGPGIEKDVTEGKVAEMQMCPVVRKGIVPSSQIHSSRATLGH